MVGVTTPRLPELHAMQAEETGKPTEGELAVDELAPDEKVRRGAGMPAASVERPSGPKALPGPQAAGLAALSGILYWLAFAGMDIWPLAFVAFVPLWFALRGQAPKRATWLGLLAGTTMNVAGFFWLVEMLKTFSGFPTALCLVFVVIICSYQGGRMALFGWLHARATERGWPAKLVFLGAFVASELVYPLLFPWFYAATVHQVPLLTQTADLGGPILVGLVLCAPNLALIDVVESRLDRRPLDRRLIAACGAAFGIALVYGQIALMRLETRIAGAEKLHVGLVQGNLGLTQKREDPAEGLRRHKRLTMELRDKGVELVVWSESSVTFPVPDELAFHFMKERVTKNLGVSTIFGGVIYRKDSDRERWFNTALSATKEGDVTSRYDKQFLLAFGEYLPFGDTFPKLYQMSPNSGRFSKGTKMDPLLVTTGGRTHHVAALICYEDIAPAFTNDVVSATKPELIVNLTNDAWFGDTAEPWEHLALSTFRAIEHRRYFVRSTNSGVSAIVDPAGRILTHTNTFVSESKDAEVRWLSGSTVYEFVGDKVWWLVSLAMVVFAFKRRPVAGATA
jgi:apolipoprotein N-acyltransferase